MYISIISCSLNSESTGFMLAEYAKKLIERRKINVDLIDIRKWKLPFCDGESTYENSSVKKLSDKLSKADFIIFVSPVYNYDLNAVAKNIVELCGHALKDKVIGIMSTSGGPGSYMAPGSFILSLLFDFHCYIVPQVIYTVPSTFKDYIIADKKVHERIEQMIEKGMQLVKSKVINS